MGLRSQPYSLSIPARVPLLWFSGREQAFLYAAQPNVQRALCVNFLHHKIQSKIIFKAIRRKCAEAARMLLLGLSGLVGLVSACDLGLVPSGIPTFRESASLYLMRRYAVLDEEVRRSPGTTEQLG
jgi:hypothetical protein